MSPVICYLRYTFLYAIQWTSVQYFIFISRDFLITILALVISFWWCLCLSLFFSSRLLLLLLLLLYIYQITVSLNLFKQRTHVLSIMMWLPFLSPPFSYKNETSEICEWSDAMAEIKVTSPQPTFSPYPAKCFSRNVTFPCLCWWAVSPLYPLLAERKREEDKMEKSTTTTSMHPQPQTTPTNEPLRPRETATVCEVRFPPRHSPAFPGSSTHRVPLSVALFSESP